MIIIFNAEKAFDKIQHLCMINVLERLGIQGIYLNIIKKVYSRPIANMNWNGEKFKAIPLISGILPDSLLSPWLFRIVLEVLTRTKRQVMKIKGKQTEKKEVKVSLFVNDMLVYISDLENFHQNFPTADKQFLSAKRLVEN